MAVFGPRTTVVFSVDCGSPYELMWAPPPVSPSSSFQSVGNEGKWFLMSCPTIRASKAKLFAPANLRAAQELSYYKNLVNYWMEEKYTLRYTGGLVPDVYQILVKGQGIFCNPVSKSCPAKLRLVYECAPMAALVEGAGGKSSDGVQSILDVVRKERAMMISKHEKEEEEEEYG